MADVISISNRALLAVGARAQISSLTEGSAEANAINVLWTPTFEALGRTANWNCLRKEANLSLLAAAQGTPENPDGTTLPTPPIPWLYSYAYPADCLRFQYIIPSLPSGNGTNVPATTINNVAGVWLPQGGGQIPFVVSSDDDSNNNPIMVIYTNQSQAVGIYTKNQPNPAIWDSMFQQAMVSSLAAYLVPALSLSLPLMQLSIQNAERLIQEARAADGNEGVTVMDHYPDWMQARWGASGYGIGWNITTYGGYVNMVWPGGYYN